MKFIEIVGNIRVPVSNEEQLVAEMIKRTSEPFPRKKLNIRERELARQLVHKGIIDRVMIEEELYFVYNDLYGASNKG